MIVSGTEANDEAAVAQPNGGADRVVDGGDPRGARRRVLARILRSELYTG